FDKDGFFPDGQALFHFLKISLAKGERLRAVRSAHADDDGGFAHADETDAMMEVEGVIPKSGLHPGDHFIQKRTGHGFVAGITDALEETPRFDFPYDAEELEDGAIGFGIGLDTAFDRGLREERDD